MLAPYEDRLIAIKAIIESPERSIVEEGYDLLFNLWLDYSSYDDFNDNLQVIAREHPYIVNTFRSRINKLTITDDKRKTLTEIMNSLFPFLEINESNEEKEEKNEEFFVDMSGSSSSKPLRNINHQLSERYSFTRISISESTAGVISLLISLAVLIAGLSAGYGIPGGIIFALILFASAVFILLYNIINKKG